MKSKLLWVPVAASALGMLLACGPSESPAPSPEPQAGLEPDPPAGAQGADQGDPDAPAPADERLGQAFVKLGEGDYATCRELARAVLVEHPGHPRAELILGLGLHKAKRYEDALPHLQTAARSTVDFAGRAAVPYYLGWCHYWLGQFDAARARFEQHLEATEEGDSRFGLGIIALELGQLEEARRELDKAFVIFENRIAAGELAAARDLAKTHARLADVDLFEDQVESAREHLQAALGMDPARPAVWFKLYQVALELEDAALARQALAEYDRRRPKDGTGMAMEGGS